MRLLLGVISDEVSQDIAEASAFARAFCLDGLELRSVEGKGPFEYDGLLVRRVHDVMEGNGLAVSCLSLPLFKCDIFDASERKKHVEGLKRSVEHARALDCRLLRGFCFWRRENEPAPVERIAEAYAGLIPIVRDAGMTIVLESDPSVYASTARELARVLSAIDDDCVRAVWDGGNYLFVPDGGVPCEEYRFLRPFVRHVHVKDAVRGESGASAVKVGDGQADVRGQLALLCRDGYDGWLSLETHYRRGALLSEEQMRLPGGASFSEGASAASAESMLALRRMMKEEGMIQ